MEIIDTHQHTWEIERFDYSWCRPIAALNRSFRLDEYKAAAEGLAIRQTVLVEADIDEEHLLDETRHLLELAARESPQSGVVAGARPEDEGFPAYLERIAGHPCLKGVRRVLHTQPDELSTSERFRRNVDLLADYGLSFDICVQARQLPRAIELAQSCPRVLFILDHCGNPPLGESEAGGMDEWRRAVRRIAALPNVVCKISGLATQVNREEWRAEDLRPAIDEVTDCFGWERVMFGSDWPVLTLAGSLRRWVEAIAELTSQAGDEKQRMLFSGNARRIYRL